MVSDDDSDNSSEPDHRNSTEKLKRSVKKRRRKTGLESSLKDKKRKAIDNRIDASELEQNQLGGVSGVGSGTQGLFPPTLASLLTPSQNQSLTLDPSFFNSGAEPLRRWMHLTRTPSEMQHQSRVVDPFALSVAGLPSHLFNQPSLLPRLPYFSGVGGAAASTATNPSFADMLNLAMSSVQTPRQQPLNMDAALRREISLATAQRHSGWNPLSYGQPSMSLLDQTRLERAPMSINGLGRAGLGAGAASALQETMPMLHSGESILATFVSARASSRPSTQECLLLSIPEDEVKLNEQQVFLRRQIEVFRATEDDIMSHTRGRNKPISLGQAGLRCRHCGHLPVSKRRKGSTYFPSSLVGIYQAAQNLGVEHLFSLVCPELPPDICAMASDCASKKFSASNAGKPYWAESGKKLGLVDTDYGMRFVEDIDRDSG